LSVIAGAPNVVQSRHLPLARRLRMGRCQDQTFFHHEGPHECAGKLKFVKADQKEDFILRALQWLTHECAGPALRISGTSRAI
jgi:hypothetical protein